MLITRSAFTTASQFGLRPYAFVLLFLAVLFSSGCASHDGGSNQTEHTLTGDIRLHKNFHSQILGNDRDIIVYLPPGYERETARKYPVLYMSDGQNIFDAATSFFPGMERHMDERAQELIEAGEVEPLIIVGVYSLTDTRIDEFTPTRPARMNRGGRLGLYGRMIVEEVKPFIESNYRTLPGTENTGLGGSSLGGLATMHLGLKYPNVFGKLAISSPAADWDDYTVVREVEGLREKPRLKIWLGVGTAEESEFLEGSRRLRDALISKGWVKGEDFLYYEAEGAKHRPDFWARRVDRLLRFLFPKQPENQRANAR